MYSRGTYKGARQRLKLCSAPSQSRGAVTEKVTDGTHWCRQMRNIPNVEASALLEVAKILATAKGSTHRPRVFDDGLRVGQAT